MFAKINKILSKLRKNNDGLSIVTVIVAIGFVLIIVSILMTTSTINFRMKNVNYYAKDSFYSSEQVLDEINAGLQQLVSEGLSNAYKEVLTTYGKEDFNSDDKNEMVKGAYYDYIIKKLGYQVDGTTWRYIAMPSTGPSGAAAGTVYASSTDAASAGVKEGLYSFIKGSTRWHENGIDGSYGAYLRAKGGNSETPTGFSNGVYYGEMKVTATDGIYLKDLIVYYRDSNGVVSEVKTDIHLVYPEFAFSNPSMPEISSYTFITDSGLLEKKAGTSKGLALTTKIIGDSFAYKVETSGVKINYEPSGTVLEPAVDTHIVATGLNVVNGGIKTYDSTRLWAGDIIAKSSTVNLDGYTYVLDDMNLQGKNPSLTITGYYTGYGNSLDSSEESSAILVNGVDSIIDLEYVKKLSLAGRAFIGLSKGSSSVSNVYIGSSISAKSDQLMYLIPGECIGVDAAGNSRYAKNPLTKGEYESIIGDSNYTLIARGKHLDKLGSGTTADKLDDYIKEGDEGYKRVEVTSKDGHTTLYYFYMSFKNDEAANLFFEKYYNQNMNSVDKYLNQYIGQLTFPGDTDAMLRVSMAGNTLEDTDEVGSDGYKKHVVAGIFSTKKSDAENIADSFDDENKAFSEQFIAYNTKLTPSLDNVAELIQRAGDNKAVFKNIINQASLEDVLDGSNHMFFQDGTGTNKAVLIHRAPITPETTTTPAVYQTVNLTAEDMACNLIIADCNVKIPDGVNKFEGTMLVQGTIEIPSSGNFEFKANPKLVNRCMVLQDSLGVYSVYDVFNDVSKMSSAALNGLDSEDIYLSDLVQFSNWSRNANINAGTTGG